MEIYNANEILQRLTFFSNLSTKKELSKVLNVSYNTLQTWIKRNSIDFDYIYSHVKKNNISLDKLFKIDEDSEVLEKIEAEASQTTKKQKLKRKS